MKNQILIKKKQKEILAEFYSNFALAWFSFGLISPIFNRVENINELVFDSIASFGGGLLFLALSFSTIKSIWN